MKNPKWRKAAAFLLTCALLVLPLSCGFAENPGGEGTVILLDPPAGEPAGYFQAENTEPFVPDHVRVACLAPEPPAETGDEGVIVDGTVFNYGDARITVENTDEYPYSAIAYMKMCYTCGCDGTGSGFMVGPDRLLTAAHCLVCTAHSAWADRITFYFGFRDETHYLYKYDGRWTAYAGNLFKNKKYTTDWDYGCMKLEEAVGNEVGWFGYQYGVPDRTLKSTYLYIAGYRFGVLTRDGGYAVPRGRQCIEYTMDMEPGNSGSPVFTADYHAFAINIAENDKVNTGYRLTDYVIDELNKLK